MRYLGIDYGTRKTGLALSDESGSMGFPHAVVPTAELLQTVAALIKEKAVGAVVIGDSKALDGSDNPIAAEARAFAEQLAALSGVPIHWEPEMFTSAEARRMHAPEAKSRAPRSRADVDASAAALTLTSYLGRTHGT
jgi:putative Holliday junction resolvase